MSSSNETILMNKHLLPTTVSVLCGILPCKYELVDVSSNQPIQRIVVSHLDSIQNDCLFIPYEESDEQCVDMVNKGACCIMTDHLIKGVPCVVVESLIDALYSICKWMFEEIGLPSVVVAGSEGKTTTKRMIKRVLETERSVFCQIENYNTFQALCCSLQQIICGTEVIVQEVDEKRINSTSNCSKILKPRVAVVTNIAEAHIGFYGSKEALIRSFLGITQGMLDDGVVIINGDDNDSLRADFGKKVVTVGIQNETCDYLAKNIISNLQGTKYDLYSKGNRIATITLRVNGVHNVYNSMMAFVVGRLHGISVSNICKSLLAYKNSGIRQNVSKLGKIIIYADCYNASATSVRFAIKCFDDITIGKKTVLVLGDIAEIEGLEEETYRQIADYVNLSHADAICTYGKDSSRILRYVTRPIEKKETKNLIELVSYLKILKKSGYTCFMFKASRIMKMEQVIAAAFPLQYKLIKLKEKLSK